VERVVDVGKLIGVIGNDLKFATLPVIKIDAIDVSRGREEEVI
jgi:hypothetical protein